MEKESVLKIISLQTQIERIDKLIEAATVKVNVGNYQQFFYETDIDAYEIEERLTKNLKSQIKRKRDKLQKELDAL